MGELETYVEADDDLTDLLIFTINSPSIEIEGRQYTIDFMLEYTFVLNIT